MIRWKLRNRSKLTEDTTGQTNISQVETKKQTQATTTIQSVDEEPVMEYSEVLYAQTTPLKKQPSLIEPKKEPLRRTSWENLEVIGHNVDRIGLKKVEPIASNQQTSNEIEKKVDRLLAKKKLER
jgi:hypothetical protein